MKIRDAAFKKKQSKPIAVPLAHVASKYSVKSLSEFLFQPLRVRSSGRMPDLKLTPAESMAIAGYLIGEESQPIDVLNPDPVLVEQGRKHFVSLKLCLMPTPCPALRLLL